MLFLTAGYLFAWPSPNVPYFAAVILHLGGGLAFFLALGMGLRRILREGSRLTSAAWLLLLACGVVGLILIYTGTPHTRWNILWAHIVAGVAGGALLAAARVGRRSTSTAIGGAWQTAFRCVVFLAVAGALVAAAWWVRTVPWERANRIANPAIAPETMDAEGDGPGGKFFPSSAQTSGKKQIPADYFIESQTCQRCHADVYKQWQGSMHHFSSFNNAWYRKSIEYMQDTVGVQPSKWCAGCHDPALLYSGMFDRPIREVEDTPAGQAGLGCMMCHSVVHVKSTMGQADFQLEYPALHRLAASKNPAMRWAHDYLTNLNPEPHRRVFLKPFMKTQTAQFCSTCHKVHLDVPVNHYRWVRGFNDYDNWQASGVSGQGARSFYYPTKPAMCADCHMPLTKSNDMGATNGLVHSHQFPAANTAVPYVNGDAAQLEATENFLKAKQVSVDIFAISPEAPEKKSATELRAARGSQNSRPAAAPGADSPGIETTFAVGEESSSPVTASAAPSDGTAVNWLTAPLDRTAAAVRRGETYRVDVVVRTRGVGHFFPGGTVDAFECWLELKATDDQGRTIFWSGSIEDGGQGPVEAGAHLYRSLQIDGHGNPINKRNAWSTRATVYAHLIPPGAADTVHFRMRVPPNAGQRIHLEAKLKYRKFAWYETQFAFAGVREAVAKSGATTADFDDARYAMSGDPAKVPGGAKGIPDPPIVVVAENSADLNTLAANSPEPKPQVKLLGEDWTRWNDYGIGLFLQGDLTGAAAAFEKITQVAPKNPDGWVNVGRVRVQEGNLAAGEEVLDTALKLAPMLARANYFYERVLRGQGKYDQAAVYLRKVIEQYPNDRVVHDDLGRVYFLQRKYSEAVQEFSATIAIDPEDLEANYNLMLCYTGLGQASRAAEFQKRYLRFKADEASQTLTGPYRRQHPEDNLERQPIHEHVSVSLEKSVTKKSAGQSSAEKESD